MKQRRFVLGIGAQKSGTSWLHRYLESKKNVNLGFRKEYHIWDAKYTSACSQFRVYWLETLISEEKRKIWLMQNTDKYYFDYFCSILDMKDVEISGDITPSYSSLKSEVFGAIKSSFAQRNVRVSVVFLMRDPAERCISALSMKNKKTKFRNDCSDELIKRAKTDAYKIRTNYDETILELEKAFSVNEVYYGIYEEMFNEQKIEELSHFLGVDSDPSFAQIRFNESPKISIDKSAITEIAKEYKKVYEFALKRFPQVETLWANINLAGCFGPLFVSALTMSAFAESGCGIFC
jgi:Sulfotransferase domain